MLQRCLCLCSSCRTLTPSSSVLVSAIIILVMLQGCVEFAGSKKLAVPQGNILLLVSSSIPPAAGLSSSSALVVATAMALLELWGIAASPNQVAEFTCRCDCADTGLAKILLGRLSTNQ